MLGAREYYAPGEARTVAMPPRPVRRSRAGYARKLLAQSPTLLPSKPRGAAQAERARDLGELFYSSRRIGCVRRPGRRIACCCGAQLLMITLTRSVTLVPITAPRDAGHVAPGAWGAVISDGEVATGFGLPFLLGTAELGEVNALRAALSGTVRRSISPPGWLNRRENSRDRV